MVNTIAPLQYFPISRVLPDPSDATTYYIQAVVRNASTNTILATINLDSQGSQIYSALWRAPALASSSPLFITITTLVYTDAGYSVPSSVYGNDQDTYQIYDLTNQTIISAQQIAAIVSAGLPGPGDGMDYKKLERIILKALKPVADKVDEIDRMYKEEEDEEIEPKKRESIDLTPVTTALERLEAKSIDLSPVLSTLETHGARLDDIKGSITNRDDLNPLLDHISSLHAHLVDEVIPSLKDHMSTELQTLPDNNERIIVGMDSLTKVLGDVNKTGPKTLDTLQRIQKGFEILLPALTQFHSLIGKPSDTNEKKSKEDRPWVQTIDGKFVKRL